MKAVKALFFAGIFYSWEAASQSLRNPASIHYVALGAYSNAQTDPFSFTGNTAALARAAHAGVGIYSERRFMISELSSYCMAAVFPGRLGNFGLQVNYGGFKSYNESGIGLAYARNLGPRTELGIKFNYNGYRVPGYIQSASMNFEAGAILHMSQKLLAGFHVYDPVGGRLGKKDAGKTAFICSMGLGFDASANFFAGCRIIKEEDKPVNVAAGFRYQFSRQFFANAGIAGDNGNAYAGAGVKWNELRLDLTAGYHPVLGITPGILMVVDFKKREK